jgi:hypothetical protein
MKKSILGLALLAATGMATAVYGQGHILISNYLTPPYNQVVWGSDPAQAPAGEANMAVADFTLQFQVFYGKGTITDPTQLTAGQTFNLDNSPSSTGYDPGAGHGAGGYFLNVDQVLPGWSSGDTYTFMYEVAPGQGVSGQSALWQESSKINPYPNVAAVASAEVPGLVITQPIPEPTSLALLGLGSLGMLFLRRRKA